MGILDRLGLRRLSQRNARRLAKRAASPRRSMLLLQPLPAPHRLGRRRIRLT